MVSERLPYKIYRRCMLMLADNFTVRSFSSCGLLRVDLRQFKPGGALDGIQSCNASSLQYPLLPAARMS
ncbi:hypothetical protein EV356DRAFT_507680 [Viridothelium virens]|uniref:Uncharacterized protein n=1 Tax=Viridothelium virens TaxID=1048519 RepID=A0A6A6H040_VIRVR|nr:hypothetical protein EV356DRAFT_507680 [Viridothelium virens]